MGASPIYDRSGLRIILLKATCFLGGRALHSTKWKAERNEVHWCIVFEDQLFFVGAKLLFERTEYCFSFIAFSLFPDIFKCCAH